MFVFDGIGYLFSMLLFNLKFIVVSLHSCGKSVERITAYYRVNKLLF